MIYQEDTLALLAARTKSKVIHNTGDIDASGDEVEQPIRDFLSKRLPAQFVVIQGHIVDRHQRVSPQIDGIIADSSATPVRFQSENGTHYVP